MRARPGMVILLAAFLGLAACGADPVALDSPGGILDLRSWNFASSGTVLPQGWQWDLGVLWSPVGEGRPESLPPPAVVGPPDKGQAFAAVLHREPLTWRAAPVALATGRLRILVEPEVNYGLQIGALPGAFRVWVNDTLVWETGVLSSDPRRYRADGRGTLVTVQPRNGMLDLVLEVATDDPLVVHSEANRLWIVGPAASMMDAEWAEKSWRALQAVFLFLGILVFLWLFRLRPERGPLVWFVGFLVVCLLKLAANVEQPQPFLSPVLPWFPLSWYLFLNHGLNLLPFPLLVTFLVKQFPGDIGPRSAQVAWSVTAVTTVWELLPFVFLSLGWDGLYGFILRAQWSFVLNLYVVLGILFIFERFHLVYQRRRPMARALFFGGMSIGLVVLLPIPLSFFVPVKFTYFLGWGMFLFLSFLGFSLIRFQVKASQDEVLALTRKLEQARTLGRFTASEWALRLGQEALEDLKPGAKRSAEVVLVRIRCEAPAEAWLALVGPPAAARQALMVEFGDGAGTWALDAWSEVALAFSLEVQTRLEALPGAGLHIVMTRALVQFCLLEAGPLWHPVAQGLPRERLAQLEDRAVRYGATVLLDVVLQDGLVIGGWKRHRQLTVAGTEIELYQGEEEALALLKDKSLDAFESALAQARAGRFDEAVRTLVPVVQANPFDQASRVLLTEWGPRRPL